MKKLILYLSILGISTSFVQPAQAISDDALLGMGITAAILAVPVTMAAVATYNWVSDKLTSNEEALIQIQSGTESIELCYRTELGVVNHVGPYPVDFVPKNAEEKIERLIQAKTQKLRNYSYELNKNIQTTKELKARLEKRLAQVMQQSDFYLLNRYEKLCKQIQKLIEKLCTLSTIVNRLVEKEKDQKTYYDASQAYIRIHNFYEEEFTVISQLNTYYNACLTDVVEARIVKIAEYKGYKLGSYRYPLINYKNELERTLFYTVKPYIAELGERLTGMYKRYEHMINTYYPLAAQYEILITELKNSAYVLQKILDTVVNSSSYRSELHQQHFDKECYRLEREQRELQRDIERLKREVKEKQQPVINTVIVVPAELPQYDYREEINHHRAEYARKKAEEGRQWQEAQREVQEKERVYQEKMRQQALLAEQLRQQEALKKQQEMQQQQAEARLRQEEHNKEKMYQFGLDNFVF
ncbi:MAG: hypothetical protein WA432_02405 [Candidatus Babeliaceae bacterium]